VGDRPDWLSEGVRYLRALAQREDPLLTLPPSAGERRTLTPPQAEQTTPAAGPLPWEGHPPRPQKDPVGIPPSLIAPVPSEGPGRAAMLERLAREAAPCLKCTLGETRTNFVFGVGAPHATLMFVGEAPGADEDAKGEPFVGRAGRLLDRIIESIGFTREEVYIANILKCRPPDNRDPLPREVDACEPYLHRQIALIRPAVLCALGRVAAQTLLRTNTSLTKMRGKVHRYQGVPLVVTYHPAALLRNPNWKRPTWDDMQELRRIHDEEVGR
jgi:DNA polymerase